MLRVNYSGSQIGNLSPDITFTGDIPTDNAALATGLFIPGRIMAIKAAAAGTEPLLTPCDGDTMVPFGTLMNGASNYAESIGSSGSRKLAVIRAFPVITVDQDAYVGTTFTQGQKLYCADVTTPADAGKWTTVQPVATAPVTGIVLHAHTTSEPWLTIAQLF